MSFLSDIYNYFKNQALYITGRGLMSAALITAAFIPASLSTVVLIASGTALLQGWVTWRRQSQKEDQMVKDYREEIAARLGIKESEVTANELHIVAYGDPSRGLEGNYVLAQSLERSGQRKLVGLLSTVASAFITMGAVILFADTISSWLKPLHEYLRGTLQLGFVQPELKWFSLLLVSGTGMSLMNNVIDYGVEWTMGLNRRTAHSLTRDIKRDIEMNKTITQEQVFGVFVAANPGLDRTIENAYGKPYYELRSDQKTHALHQYGGIFQNPAVVKRTIAQLTQDLNNRQIEADELVFAVVNQESGVPRLKEAQPVGKEKSEVRQMQQELTMALRGEHKSAAEHSRDVQRDIQLQEEIANDNQHGFAARFAPRDTNHQSHAERVGHQDKTPTMSHVQRELERVSKALDALPDLKR